MVFLTNTLRVKFFAHSVQGGALVKGRPAEDGHDRVDEQVAEGVAGVVPGHGFDQAAGTKLLAPGVGCS